MGKRQSKLKSGALENLRSVTQLGDAEIIELHNDFLKDCPSGLVKVEMFMTLYRKLFPHGDSLSFAEHVFRTFNTNGDDSIDFREFLCALSIVTAGKMEKKLESGVQKVGTAGTAGAGQITFGWTK